MNKRSIAYASAIFGCVILANGCGNRTFGTSTPSTPSAPSGPVQTASTSERLLPAGTVLPIRLNEQIDTSQEGGTFKAELAQDVVTKDYDVLIRRGAPAQVTVVRTDRGGTVGTPEVELALQSITVDGRVYSVNSGGNVQTGEEGLGKNERTAKMVGGGAVLGTVIGAIAGGGSGAAIGAAVGAAGGAAAQVLTRGKEVKVPAETVLSFQIQQPIELRS